MDAHGGWIGSAVDLARFVSALEGSYSTAILRPETLEAMLARPAAPLWEEKPDYYALGWRVRPTRKGATWWHTGSMAGSTAVLYRTSSGLIWVALFNASPDPSQGNLLVDVIAAMGRATLISRISWRYWPVLALLAAAGLSAALLAHRQKRRAHQQRTSKTRTIQADATGTSLNSDPTGQTQEANST
jgi:CubicO group peptidase (beta-lactamase class C family)